MRENSNWHTFNSNWHLKKKTNQTEFLKGPESQTEDNEVIGKLKLLQITYQGYNMTEVIYGAEFSSRHK